MANRADVVGSHAAGQTVVTGEHLTFIPGRFIVVYFGPKVAELRWRLWATNNFANWRGKVVITNCRWGSQFVKLHGKQLLSRKSTFVLVGECLRPHVTPASTWPGLSCVSKKSLFD
jgi:hypothetical protein